MLIANTNAIQNVTQPCHLLCVPVHREMLVILLWSESSQEQLKGQLGDAMLFSSSSTRQDDHICLCAHACPQTLDADLPIATICCMLRAAVLLHLRPFRPTRPPAWLGFDIVICVRIVLFCWT